MTESVVRRRAEIASQFQRSLGGDYIVVASPDHPLVLRSADVLVGGPSGLTAVMIASSEELRRPKLFEARLTLNTMALPPHTSFIHIKSQGGLPEIYSRLFFAEFDFEDRNLRSDLVKIARDPGKASRAKVSESKQRRAERRFADTYRLAQTLHHHADRFYDIPQKVARMPDRDIFENGVSGAFFRGEPSPSALKTFILAECEHWFAPTINGVELRDEPAGLAFAQNLPELPGDPLKALRAAAFAGWVIAPATFRRRSPHQVAELVHRYTRLK